MKYVVITVLMLSLTLSACVTGRATDIAIDPNNPGIYIDGPDRIDVIGSNTPLIELSLIAAGYDNISGFQFDLGFSGPAIYAGNGLLVPGGVFGTSENGTYVCIPPTVSAGLITDLACLALPGSPFYPNSDGFGYLYNVSFVATATPGNAVFTIDTTDPETVLTDVNGQSISLLPGTASKTVQICRDSDEDGEYSTLACEFDGNFDCNENDRFIYNGQTEFCNTVNNNCVNGLTDSQGCGAVTPSITGVIGNAYVIYDGTAADPTPTLSGNVLFQVGVTDTSLSNSGTPAGNNVDKVEFYIDGSLVGTDNTNGQSTYGINYNTVSLSEGVHELRVVVYDTLASATYSNIVSPVEVIRHFDVNNQLICDIQSISWSQSSVNDGGSVDLTVVGGSECLGKSFTFGSGAVSYLECDGASCAPVPAAIANALPGNTISFNGTTIFVDSGIANWFLDTGDATTNPEIKLVVNDDTTVDKESGLLTIQNVAPTVTEQGNAAFTTTATAYMTVSEASSFRIDWGTAPGSYTGFQTFAGPALNHEFTISGLTPLTTYYYTITATDIGGLPVDGGEQSFTTVTYDTDFDADGDVDIFDLYEVVVYFRINRADDVAFWNNNGLGTYDLNNDQIINILDLALLVRTFTG